MKVTDSRPSRVVVNKPWSTISTRFVRHVWKAECSAVYSYIGEGLEGLNTAWNPGLRTPGTPLAPLLQQGPGRP